MGGCYEERIILKVVSVSYAYWILDLSDTRGYILVLPKRVHNLNLFRFILQSMIISLKVSTIECFRILNVVYRNLFEVEMVTLLISHTIIVWIGQTKLLPVFLVNAYRSIEQDIVIS